MSRYRGALALASLLAALGGCGGSSPPGPPPPAPRPSAAAATAPVAALQAQAPAPQVPAYDAKGRRDPFEPPEAREGSAAGPLVASAKLTGIVRGSRGALALVETADGLGYILRPGDTLGDGRLVEIGQDSVVFSVRPRPGSTTNRVVLRLPGD